MNRPAMLALSLPEAEALTLFLAKNKRLWRVMAHEFCIERPEEMEERLIEAHRAGVRLQEGIEPDHLGGRKRVPETAGSK